MRHTFADFDIRIVTFTSTHSNAFHITRTCTYVRTYTTTTRPYKHASTSTCTPQEHICTSWAHLHLVSIRTPQEHTRAPSTRLIHSLCARIHTPTHPCAYMHAYVTGYAQDHSVANMPLKCLMNKSARCAHHGHAYNMRHACMCALYVLYSDLLEEFSAYNSHDLVRIPRTCRAQTNAG